MFFAEITIYCYICRLSFRKVLRKQHLRQTRRQPKWNEK